MAGSIQTLDRPDLTVRTIMQKRRDGAKLTDKEYKRLAARTSAEEEVARHGGVVSRSIHTKQPTPYEMGQRRGEEEAGYNAARRPAQGNEGGPIGVRSQSPTAPTADGEDADLESMNRAAGPTKPAAPAAPAAPMAKPPSPPVQPRALGAPQRLARPVIPTVGAGSQGRYVGGGGNYMAEFETKKSAGEFADFAARVSAEDGAANPVQSRPIGSPAASSTPTPEELARKKRSALARSYPGSNRAAS